MMINNTGKLILAWGVLVLLGWLGPYFYPPLVTSALLYWGVLMAIALVLTHILMPNAWQNKTVQVWAAIVVLGMIENFLVGFGVIPLSYAMLSYNHLWVLLAAIGFFLTTKTWKIPKSIPIYMVAAGANAILFILLILVNPMKIDFPLGAEIFQHRWLLMGLVQGLPMIIDGATNYKVPAKKA